MYMYVYQIYGEIEVCLHTCNYARGGCGSGKKKEKKEKEKKRKKSSGKLSVTCNFSVSRSWW